jgi:hypothetical protein
MTSMYAGETFNLGVHGDNYPTQEAEYSSPNYYFGVSVKNDPYPFPKEVPVD